MFDYISGKFVREKEGLVTIDVNGIGYQIAMPTSSLFKLPNKGIQLTLYVSFIIREFAHTLYGFLNEQEREFFESLLTVSGIGPKLALSVIGTFSIPEFSAALARKDVNTLSKVPGVGKKTAERLIVEMKDKDLPLFVSENNSKASSNNITVDAMSALVNLGYTHNRAEKAVRFAIEENGESNDLSSLIATSLKHV